MAAFETLNDIYSQPTRDIVAESEDLIGQMKSSASRSEGVTNEILAIGGSTLSTLQEQGQKIKTLQPKLDEIDDHLHEGEAETRKIKSIFGYVRNIFCERKKGLKKRPKVAESRPVAISMQETIPKSSPVISPPVSMDIFSHLSLDAQQGIVDTDETIDRVGKNLDAISEIAKEMGKEINDHNRHLKSTSVHLSSTNRRVEKSSRRIRKM